MKITAIIPTFNRASKLLEAIQSIENQTYKVDEIIVIDDGSTDETKKLAQNLHVRYIYKENSGVSSARNLGIQEAKNEWLAFLDSDDTWEKEKISSQVEYHKQNPELLASYTDERWLRDDKEIQIPKHLRKENPSFENSLKTCKIGASTFVAHKSLFKDIGVFDESLQACEDYDLWLRILRKCPIGFLDKKLTCKKAGNWSQLSFETQNIDIFRIKALEKHINSSFTKDVKDELISKLLILQKGALKHRNEQLLELCSQKLENLK